MLDVWSVDLDQRADDARAFRRLLSSEESDRADRFVFDRDRIRYVVARGVLRILLSRYTGILAESIAISYGPRGKPAIHDTSLRFNLAHSSALAVFAFTRGREVGIDVEALNAIDDAAFIAERYFTPRECSVILAAQGDTRTRAFMTYWTRKEAILKLTGDGLSLPLNTVDVSWTDEISPGCLSLTDVAGTPWRARVRDLKIAPGYAAAVAVEGEEADVEYFNFDDDGPFAR